MKKLLFLAVAVFAIGSIGGHINPAHAQTATATLTPSQLAALQQELAVAKATLANSEMQAGMIPGGDSGAATPAVTTPVAVTQTNGLTASQISAFDGVLNTLATTLGTLNASIEAHPTLTPAQSATAQATLGDMSNVLATMSTNITSDIAANNVAMNTAPVATPSPVAVNSAPSSAVTAPTTGSAPAMTQPSVAANTGANPAAGATPATTPSQPTPVVAANPVNTTAPQTAQASSLWGFTKSHWPTIVIVLLVIAILAILFWPEKEAVRTVTITSAAPNKPKASEQSNVTVSRTDGIASSPSSNNGSAPATPVANAVAAPAQK